MFAKFLLLLLCPIALCAESKILKPLVVSGDKLNKWAEQVSGSVMVLGPERLAALPPSSGTYQDLLVLTAGAYAGNPGVGTFSLRGLNQDNVFGYLGTGSNALINVMMDGAPLSPSALRYLPPLRRDLAGAEVLRGPQSLSHGPNSMGGALLLQSYPPGFDVEGKALSEVSDDGGLRFGLAQDFTLLPDELALRMSYLHQQSDGHETNLYSNDDEFGATRRDNLEVRLRWHPAKNRDATFDLALVRDRSRGNPFAMVLQKPGGSLLQRETSVNTDSAYPADRLAATLSATVALPQDLELKSVTSVQRLDFRVGTGHRAEQPHDQPWRCLRRDQHHRRHRNRRDLQDPPNRNSGFLGLCLLGQVARVDGHLQIRQRQHHPVRLGSGLQRWIPVFLQWEDRGSDCLWHLHPDRKLTHLVRRAGAQQRPRRPACRLCTAAPGLRGLWSCWKAVVAVARLEGAALAPARRFSPVFWLIHATDRWVFVGSPHPNQNVKSYQKDSSHRHKISGVVWSGLIDGSGPARPLWDHDPGVRWMREARCL